VKIKNYEALRYVILPNFSISESLMTFKNSSVFYYLSY